MATTFNFWYLWITHLYCWWPTCQHFQQVWNGLNQICWQLPEGYFICSLLTVLKHSLFVNIGRWLHKEFTVSPLCFSCVLSCLSRLTRDFCLSPGSCCVSIWLCFLLPVVWSFCTAPFQRAETGLSGWNTQFKYFIPGDAVASASPQSDLNSVHYN